MPYVDLRGVGIWYEEQGGGDALHLIHAGVSDSRFFEQNIGFLAEGFHVYAADQRSHGRTPDVAGPIEALKHGDAEGALAYLDSEVVIDATHRVDGRIGRSRAGERDPRRVAGRLG